MSKKKNSKLNNVNNHPALTETAEAAVSTAEDLTVSAAEDLTVSDGNGTEVSKEAGSEKPVVTDAGKQAEIDSEKQAEIDSAIHAFMDFEREVSKTEVSDNGFAKSGNGEDGKNGSAMQSGSAKEAEADEEDEEEESEERTAFRRRRVKRLKMILVLLLIVAVLVPNIICGVLLIKMNKMKQEMESVLEEMKLYKAEVEYKAKEAAAMQESLLLEEEKKNSAEDLVQLHLTDEQRYPGKQLVYLTFDDGPSAYTDEILDILAENDVKATFFVLAKDGMDDQYNRILEEGHTLGMHSYSHRYSTIYSSLSSFEEDVNSISDFLVEHTGVKPEFYRFPGGSSNSVSKVNIQDMLHFLGQNGIVHFDWNVSSEDASPQMLETSTIARNVLNGIGNKRQSVVLMHDSTAKRTTVEALPIIIESLKRKGNVQFLPITEGTKQVYHIREEVPGEDNSEDEVASAAKKETVETISSGEETIQKEDSSAQAMTEEKDASEELEKTEVKEEEKKGDDENPGEKAGTEENPGEKSETENNPGSDENVKNVSTESTEESAKTE